MREPRVLCLMVALLLASCENTFQANDTEYEYYYEQVPASSGSSPVTNPVINTTPAVPNARTIAPDATLSTGAVETTTSTVVVTTVAGTSAAVSTEAVTEATFIPLVELPTAEPDVDGGFTLRLNDSRRWVDGLRPHPETRNNISYIQTVGPASPSGVWQAAMPNQGRDYNVTPERRGSTGSSSRQDFGRPEIVLNIFTDMYGQGTRNRNNRGGNSWPKGGHNSYWNSYQNSLQGWYGWQGSRNNRNYGMPSWQQSRGNSVYRGRQPLPPTVSNRRPQAVTNTGNRRNADQQASDALYNFLRQILQGSQVRTATTNNQPRHRPA